jgi:hypothetical protein
MALAFHSAIYRRKYRSNQRQLRFSLTKGDTTGRFPPETGEFVASRTQFLSEHIASLVRHGVVATGKDIHRCITRFGPGVNRNVGFSQQSQTSDSLRFKPVGYEIQESGTSTFRCCRDGVPEKSFVVELGGIAFIKFKNAMFPYRVSDVAEGGRRGRKGWLPSRVRVEAGQALVHRIESNFPHHRAKVQLGQVRFP